MNCQNCHQPLEAGAAFCGNCGQPVGHPAVAAAGASPGIAAIPSYALALPGQQGADIRALLALLFGIASVAGTLFMITIGLGLGLAGIVMGTMSRSSSKRGLSTAGLVVSSLAIAVNLGFWAWAVNHVEKTKQATAASHNISAPAVSTAILSTPCYSVNFVDQLNVANNSNSCDMDAYNGSTLSVSSNVYKIVATSSQTTNASNLSAIAKPAIEKDLQANAPHFAISSEQSMQFAGSPAYIVNAADSSQGAALVEAAVFHQAGNGDSIFIMVHATEGASTDLNTLEAQWQWK